jgi:hypothetical protein
MVEQTKRQRLETHLMRRAHADPGFRAELLKDPKTVIEKEIGLTFPQALTVEVHEEKLNHLHVVLPIDLTFDEDHIPNAAFLKKN